MTAADVLASIDTALDPQRACADVKSRSGSESPTGPQQCLHLLRVLCRTTV